MKVWLAALVAVFALIVAACASNEGETTGPTAATGGASGATGGTGAIPEFSTITDGVLTVGSCLDYAPFESVKNGEKTGFDVDMSEEIANRLGLTVQWVKADFDTI